MPTDNLDDVISDLIDNTEEQPLESNTADHDGIGEQQYHGPLVVLTERAAKQVRKIKTDEELDKTLKLRIAVEGGGCSGLSYKLGFDYQTEEDEILESQGIQILLNHQHKMYLEGIKIDYPDGLDARGFTFSNPNASETCGCGTSFAT